MDSLGRHSYHREGDQMIAGGELHALLLLELDPPGSQPPHKIVVPENKWDEARPLEDYIRAGRNPNSRSARARSTRLVLPRCNARAG